MSADSFVDRRGFVAGCVGAAGLLLLPAANAAVETRRLRGVSVIVDPEIEVAAAFGAALAQRGAQCQSFHGDRYRMIRGLSRTAPPPNTVAGMGTFADFIVATDTLREARYALVSYAVHPQSGTSAHRCFGQWSGCESALRQSAAAWPATLADVVAGRSRRGSPLERSRPSPAGDSHTVLSWVMLTRSGRMS